MYCVTRSWPFRIRCSTQSAYDEQASKQIK
jgi:hypothetical protein